jgi:hypothetical protein
VRPPSPPFAPESPADAEAESWLVTDLPVEPDCVPLVVPPAELVVDSVGAGATCPETDGRPVPAVWISAEATGVFALIVVLGTEASSGAVGGGGTVGVATVSGGVSIDTVGVATVTVDVGSVTVGAVTATEVRPGADAGATIASADAAARAQTVIVSFRG